MWPVTWLEEKMMTPTKRKTLWSHVSRESPMSRRETRAETSPTNPLTCGFSTISKNSIFKPPVCRTSALANNTLCLPESHCFTWGSRKTAQSYLQKPWERKSELLCYRIGSQKEIRIKDVAMAYLMPARKQFLSSRRGLQAVPRVTNKFPVILETNIWSHTSFWLGVVA